jgi:adenosylcobinamide kinase/adenosylcobinamide-phosphate guanylyltransferase
MDMLLVVGGAYAGKRSIVRQRVHSYTWLSAYNEDSWEDWNMKWNKNTTLVVEGWEKWIEVALKQDLALDMIRDRFGMFLRTLAIEEKERKDEVVLIMLEIGRGIVPINAEERKVRDVAGWLLQDAAKQAVEVIYVWHGLSQAIKSIRK